MEIPDTLVEGIYSLMKLTVARFVVGIVKSVPFSHDRSVIWDLCEAEVRVIPPILFMCD